MHTPVCAVLVAAGSGARLGAGVPKALVDLDGHPLVWHAAAALIAGGCERIVVVVPRDHVPEFAEALTQHSAVQVVCGGERRQDSVRAGLVALAAADDEIVLVHDAARPLVPAAVVRRVIDAVRSGAEAVVPAIPIADSTRRVAADGDTAVVDRDLLRAVQTPQGFPAGLLLRAHDVVAQRGIEVTDDASAAELVGARVILVAGDVESMKITVPLDLATAHSIVRGRA